MARCKLADMCTMYMPALHVLIMYAKRTLSINKVINNNNKSLLQYLISPEKSAQSASHKSQI